jgi:hypothetical protein
VADHVGRVVAVVDPRLEDHDALPGDLRAAQPADHLLALAAEHRPADHLEPAAAGVVPDHADDRRKRAGRAPEMSRPAHAGVRSAGDPDRVRALELSLLSASLLLVATMVVLVLGGLVARSSSD